MVNCGRQQCRQQKASDTLPKSSESHWKSMKTHWNNGYVNSAAPVKPSLELLLFQWPAFERTHEIHERARLFSGYVSDWNKYTVKRQKCFWLRLVKRIMALSHRINCADVLHVNTVCTTRAREVTWRCAHCWNQPHQALSIDFYDRSRQKRREKLNSSK